MRRPVSRRAELVLLIKHALINVRDLILDPWVMDNIANMCEVMGVIEDIGWTWVETICAIIRARQYELAKRCACVSAILRIESEDKSNVLYLVMSPRAKQCIFDTMCESGTDEFSWIFANAIGANVIART